MTQRDHDQTPSPGLPPASAAPKINLNPEWEVHPLDVHKLKNTGTEILILDVRQPKEWDLTHIDGAKLIPLDQLPQRVTELENWRDKPIVVHCHHGARSLRAAAWLRQAGFAQVKSMAGGIEAWSLLVDKAVGRY